MGNFLTAKWQKLLLANYEIDKEILVKYLPKHTELDLWNGVCYVSMVGFMFKDTKLKGIKIPLHTNFEEVNLRFYVKYFENGAWKRGAVFVKEIVPKPAITLVANTIYKEKYHTMPMRHAWDLKKDAHSIEYEWRYKNKWYTMQIETDTEQKEILPNTVEEFIIEHYWGYTKLSDTKTSEYQVEHPRWKTYTTKSFKLNVDFAKLYGTDFEPLNHKEPSSVFLAEGSEIAVKSGKIISM